MTSIKDYSEKMMNENSKNLKNEEKTPNLDDFFNKGLCPYCQSEEFIIFKIKSPFDKIKYLYLHDCSVCDMFWAIGQTYDDEVLFINNIELKALIEDL